MIQLTTPRTQGGPNMTSINDLYAALGAVTIDPYMKTVVINFYSGNYTGGEFVPDHSLPYVMTVTANMSLSPPIWSAFNSAGFNTGGTLSGSSQTTPINNLISAITSSQSLVEGFVSVAGGLLPGTVSAG